MPDLTRVSLDMATATGPGQSVDLEVTSYRLHTMIAVAAGTNPVATVLVEVSANQVDWASAGTLTFNGSSARCQQVTFEAPVRYLRANLTQLSGPQDGAVTATILSG